MVYLIFKDNKLLNRIVADQEFIAPYCAENGYTWEEEPEPEPPPEPEPEPTADEVLSTLLGLTD